MHGIYNDGRFDDLDLDARPQGLGRGTNSALNYLDSYASNTDYIFCNGRLR